MRIWSQEVLSVGDFVSIFSIKVQCSLKFCKIISDSLCIMFIKTILELEAIETKDNFDRNS